MFYWWLWGWAFACRLAAQEKLIREYERFRQQQTREFNDYVSRRNREFADFLKQEWKLFQSMQAVERPDDPKPDRAPVAPGREIPEVPGPAVEPLPVPQPDLTPKPIPDLKPDVPGGKPDAPQRLPQTLEFGFYGNPVSLRFSDRLKVAPGGITEAQVAAWWERMSAGPYGEFIRGLRRSGDALGLNDWGYYRLTETVAGQLFADDNARTAFVFYMMKQSGYDVRLGRGEGRLFLLPAFTTQLYGLPYFELDGKKYYRLEGDGALYTFGESEAFGKGEAIDLSQQRPLALGGETKVRELKLAKFPQLQIRLPYSPARVAYYNTIPQTDMPVYFSYPMPADTWQGVYEAFRPLAGKYSLPEFVGILLNFVQTSFEYKTDDRQFGREKYFYPEEVVAYPFCDCEDRSVFFACLVRRLTGAEVIGLHYPGHMATAVCFGELDVPGDTLVFRGKKYVVCDPTYINASVGMTMPQFRTVKPEIVGY
ncbi:MAG: hypothetical protein ACLTSL_01265 [Odoribacter splanchnicus]